MPEKDPAASTGAIQRSRESAGTRRLPLLWALHAAGGLLIRQSPALATAAGAVVLVGALAAALVARRAYVVLYAAAYVAGCEVLWRMSGAALPWESTKYALALISILLLLRMRRASIPGWAALYLALLAPGVLIAGCRLDAAALRTAVSFNLSGPLALGTLAAACSSLAVTRERFWNILWAATLPLAGVAAIALLGTISDTVRFGSESNFGSSGGFGPNQVSSVLGLAALICGLWLLSHRAGLCRRALVFAAMGAFALQSAMTFSRGGLYAAAGALLIGMAWSAGDRKLRGRALALLAAGLAVSMLWLAPAANEYTGGKLGERFAATRASGRAEIAAADLALWAANPLFGAGVGVSTYSHPRSAASHTEYTRVLAEHGLAGLAGALIFGAGLAARAFTRRTRLERGVRAALAAWALLYMGGNAMRLAAPGFVLAGVLLAVREDPRAG